jgi:hypothetical protein
VTAGRGTVLVLALLVLAGCGSSGTKARRDAVNAYFADAAKAQIGLLSKEGQFDSTLQAFSLTSSTPAEVAKLRGVRQEIDLASRNVRALRPPQDARKLHGLLVRRLALQRSVVDELIATSLYIPRLAAAGPPLHAAIVDLRSNLAAIAATPSPSKPVVASGGAAAVLDRYAAAFGGYGDELKPVSASLERLSAPPIMQPALSAQEQSLKRSIALSAAIRAALRRRDIPAANAAIHSLFTVSAALNGVQTRKRQADAARAYDARIRQIDALAKKADLERARLVRVIG